MKSIGNCELSFLGSITFHPFCLSYILYLMTVQLNYRINLFGYLFFTSSRDVDGLI